LALTTFGIIVTDATAATAPADLRTRRRNPGHSEIWSNTSKKRQLSKDSFRAVDVSKSVKALDHKAGKIYADLYERCIDFGAHPNEAALYTSMSLEKITGGFTMIVKQLQEPGSTMNLALKSTAQGGILALQLFQLIFPEAFKNSGVDEKIGKLKQGL
jgi:hypothetical protein